jgi:hypothetical protein
MEIKMMMMNLLGDNIDTINKDTETLIHAGKEVSPEVNIEETKYMLVSPDQNADQNRDIKIANRSVQNVSQFTYLGMTATNQNLIWEEIKRKNGVFWVVTPCGSCKNRRFGGTWRLLHQGDKNR